MKRFFLSVVLVGALASQASAQCEGGVCRKSPASSLPYYSPVPLVQGQPVRNTVKVVTTPVVRSAQVAVRVAAAPVKYVVVNQPIRKIAVAPVKFVRNRKPVRRVLRGAVRVATAPVRFVFRGR